MKLDTSKVIAFLLIAVGLNFYLKNFIISLGISLLIFYLFPKGNRKLIKYLLIFLILILFIKFSLFLLPLILILAGIGLYFSQKSRNFFS